jgi:acetyl esterase
MLDHRLFYFVAGLVLGLGLAFGPAVLRRVVSALEGPDRVVVYRTVDGHDLRLHVFAAKGEAPSAGAPALLLFHGGAWQYGSPEAFFPQCRVFAARGVSCISAEYRIASRYDTDPRAALEDAHAVFAHVRNRAGDLGVDAARIAVGGGSSGGHLAAMLGVASDGGDRPSALVLYNPMLDLSPGKPDHHLVAEFWQDVSPLQLINSVLPPSLILLGTEDREVPVASAQAFCDAVISHGGRCELALYEGAKHGFFNLRENDRVYFDATNERVAAFLAMLGWLRE